METKDTNGDNSLLLKHEVGYMSSRKSDAKRSLEKAISGFYFWIGDRLTPELSVVITSDSEKSFLAEPEVISKLNIRKYEWIYRGDDAQAP